MPTDAAVDEALARFAVTGPEFGPGLSNHGPMAVEALAALGRADAVSAWTDGYVQRLREHPEARNPINRAEWREALGDIARAGDWIAFFGAELRAQPWRDVLEAWVVRLGPGMMAGATHGIIRTAHAVRTLASGETPHRLHELAEGLGYWAARYQPLRGAIAEAGTLSVEDALVLVPLVPNEFRSRGLIFAAVKAVEHVDFEPVINLIDVGPAEANPIDPLPIDTVVAGITRTFVRQYLANAEHASIAFIHTVTAPSALRMIAPHLSPGTGTLAARYVWQACAAMYAAFAEVQPDDMPPVAAPPTFDEADVIDQAVAGGDEHAIKFTEACLREHRVSADPAFLVAAQDVVVRLGRRR